MFLPLQKKSAQSSNQPTVSSTKPSHMTSVTKPPGHMTGLTNHQPGQRDPRLQPSVTGSHPGTVGGGGQNPPAAALVDRNHLLVWPDFLKAIVKWNPDWFKEKGG